jgi:hypothetical protein
MTVLCHILKCFANVRDRNDHNHCLSIQFNRSLMLTNTSLIFGVASSHTSLFLLPCSNKYSALISYFIQPQIFLQDTQLLKNHCFIVRYIEYFLYCIPFGGHNHNSESNITVWRKEEKALQQHIPQKAFRKVYFSTLAWAQHFQHWRGSL